MHFGLDSSKHKMQSSKSFGIEGYILCFSVLFVRLFQRNGSFKSAFEDDGDFILRYHLDAVYDLTDCVIVKRYGCVLEFLYRYHDFFHSLCASLGTGLLAFFIFDDRFEPI